MLPDINIKNIRNILCIFMGIFIFFLSYAHASFSSNLSISGEAIVRAEANIRIVENTFVSSENGAYEQFDSKYTVDTSSHFIGLPNCDSKITYKVVIKNNTNISYLIRSIESEIPLNDNITYTITPSIQETTITSNGSQEYLITFNYKSCDNIVNESLSIVLNYTFVPTKGYIVANTANDGETSKFLETDLINNQINSISFLGHRNIPDDALGSFDVTDPNKIGEGDNVNLWYYKAEEYTDDSPLYDVYIGTNGEVYLTNGFKFFAYLTNLIQINFDDKDGVNRFNTSETTNMNSLFREDKKLASLDLVYFDTSKVTTMIGMFNSTSKLTSLDVSNFDTSNVTSMSSMFKSSAVENLDLSNFNTKKVTNMSSMFNGLNKINNLMLGKDFVTSSVTNMYDMFANFGSEAFTSLDLSSFDTSKVTNMSYMFSNCKNLLSLNLSSFNTSNVTTMSNMFNGSGKLTSLDLSSFDTSKVKIMECMFRNLSSIQTIVFGDKFITPNVTNMAYMFQRDAKLESLDLSSFDTSKVTRMEFMFNGCTKLSNLDIRNFTFKDNLTITSFLAGTNSDILIKVKSETEKNYLINLGISGNNIEIAS